VPLPRHLLQETFQNDKAGLVNSPLLRAEFVGLGPYAISAWDPGVEMVFKRFDEYYLGRPPLDRIVTKIISDPNTMVANILSGSVDVVLPLGVGIEEARSLEERWAGTSNRVIISPTGGTNFLMFQARPEYMRPANALDQLAVRQGLAYATDRAAVASIGSGGASAAADSWFAPSSQLHAQTADAVPRMPFDINLAQRRLADAGWALNANRELRSGATGERFEIEIRAAPVNAGDKTTAHIASTWQLVGAQAQPVVVSPAQATNSEYRATFPGVQITGNSTENFYTTIFDSRNVAGPENRWVGSNAAGYVDPTIDTLYRRIATTIEPDARLVLHKSLLSRLLGDAVVVPLWWTHAPTLVAGSVRGVRGLMHGTNAWNIFEWTKAWN
jgi:ABC-type transport system substrate-binding protein